MTRWHLAVGWVAIQLAFFAGWTAVEQRRHTVGASILHGAHHGAQKSTNTG
jgi:hypothetical protein